MDHCFEASNRWKGRRKKLESTFVVKYCRRELAAVPPQEGGRHAGTDVETVRVHVRGRRPSRVWKSRNDARNIESDGNGQPSRPRFTRNAGYNYRLTALGHGEDRPRSSIGCW